MRNFNAIAVEGANLEGANLTGANFARANLEGANLAGASLAGANLEGANLTRADLAGASLEGADLEGADLARADLTGAILTDTCLDPSSPIPAITDDDIVEAGLEIDGDYVIGWRTARSMHAGSTEYVPGMRYVAAYFSVAATECHPGLYFASRAWVQSEYPESDHIRVRCARADLHRAGKKWRCRSFEVIR